MMLRLCPKRRDGEYIKYIANLYVRCRLHYYFKLESKKLFMAKTKKNRSDKSQRVAIGMTTSEGKCLKFGVPQGSVRYVADIICSTTDMQMIPRVIWRSCLKQLGPTLQRNWNLDWLISVLG